MIERLENPPPPPPISSRDRPFIFALILLTILVFGQTVWFDFTLWDDDLHITKNPLFHPPRMGNISYYWTRPILGMYVPLTYSIWTLIGMISMKPAAFHAANVLLHAGCVVMVYIILRQLIARPVPAALAAMIFAVHPLQVEAVAWISGFRDLLCALFVLIAVWQYAIYIEWRQARNYILAIAACAAAILSKPTAVITPLLFLIVGRWIDRPWRLLIREIMPPLILSVACIVWTKLAQPQTYVEHLPPWTRLLVAGDALAFYITKLVWPMGLAFDYGRTPQVILDNHEMFFTWAIPVSLTLTLLLSRNRVMLAAGAIFFAAVLPVLGLAPFDFQDKSTVADRYIYLSMLGVAIALARVKYRGLLIGIIIALSVVNVIQARHWRDSRALANRALSVNPNSFVSLNMLAAQENDNTEVEKLSLRSLEARPDNISALVNLGRALAMQERYTEAIVPLERAVHVRPYDADAHASLAAAYFRSGRIKDAWQECNIALKLNPNHRAARIIFPLLQQAMKPPVTTQSRP